MGALQTYGIALQHGHDIDAQDTGRRTANLHAAALETQSRQAREFEEIVRAAARKHFGQDTPGTLAATAAPQPSMAVAGGGGVTTGPAPAPGTPAFNTDMNKAAGFANGGMVGGDSRSGKFDGVPDWGKWDGQVKSLPTMYKMSIHSDTGVSPDDEDFFGKLSLAAQQHSASQQAQQQVPAFADGGMVGNPPFPGFADGTKKPLSPVDRAAGTVDRMMTASAEPTASQGNFFNGSPKDPSKEAAQRAQFERLMRERGVVKKADGGALGQQPGVPLQGPGIGTSDSIPALIDGQQPAALSAGEMVIPADVVAAKGSEFFTRLIEKYHTEVNDGGN